jgi:lipoprotein-anchoring transpeptidase ErfK/SrfK
MKSHLSRRDFLKLSGITLGGLAFSPFLPGLTDFDDSFVVRIATAEMPVRAEPTDKSRIYQSWYRDELVHVYEQVVAEEPKHNPVWYRVWGGYLHRGRLQRVKTIYQTPVDITEGNRVLAAVTVPFTAPYWFTKARGWETRQPPLYYGSVHWVEAVEDGPPMVDYAGPWYRIFDELDSNVPYHVPAIHLRIVPLDIFDPISPEVPNEEKKIEVNLTTQTLIAYEYGKSVFQTNVSTGIRGGGLSGDKGLSTTTPNGKFTIVEKMPSKHMGYSYFNIGQGGNLLADDSGYVLPGIPWTSFIAPLGKPTAGHAFHGTYWHENFGTEMSHGCINMRTNEANWIFRWAQPPHTTNAISNHSGQGTAVEIHY